MNRTVYKSEEGQKIIEEAYRVHLNSDLARGMEQKKIHTPYGVTFILEKSEPGKPPLVLLHGSVSNSASWLGVIPMYAQKFSVYCVDIPGEPGFSTSSRFPLKSDSPEKWLLSVIDTLGLDTVSFLGMSLGGWYALNFAIRNPERVTAVSLIGAGGVSRQKAGFIFKALFYILLGKRGQDLLNKTIYHKTEIAKEILAYQALVSKHFRPVIEPLPLFSDEQLLKLTMPIQYFGGDRDALLDTKKAVARLSALLPQSKAVLLKDTGHALVDKFEETRDFLSQNSSSYAIV